MQNIIIKNKCKIKTFVTHQMFMHFDFYSSLCRESMRESTPFGVVSLAYYFFIWGFMSLSTIYRSCNGG